MVGVSAISNGSDRAEGAEGADGETTRHVRGARGRLGGHAPKFGTRFIMVSSMGGNVVGDVVDSNVASKTRDVGDNGGMTCGGEVSRGGVEYANDMKVWEGGVEFLGGMEVSLVERTIARPPDRRPPRSLAQPGRLWPRPSPLPRPRIGCILIVVDDARGLMDGECNVDASSSYAAMRWSPPIRCKTDLAIR